MLSYFTPDILLFFAGQREGYIIGKLLLPEALECDLISSSIRRFP
jgi:hypothetical protein